MIGQLRVRAGIGLLWTQTLDFEAISEILVMTGYRMFFLGSLYTHNLALRQYGQSV